MLSCYSSSKRVFGGECRHGCDSLHVMISPTKSHGSMFSERLCSRALLITMLTLVSVGPASPRVGFYELVAASEIETRLASQNWCTS